MAILVNWFEVTFDCKECTFPYLTSPSWEESSTILEAYRTAEIVRVRQPDGGIRLYFVTGKPASEFAHASVALANERSVAARVVEYNLAKFFEKPGMRVNFDHHWGVEITREVQKFPHIGLTIHHGVTAKYFAVTESKYRHGITLNWIVRPLFTLPLSDLPAAKPYDGFPVILKWPATFGTCPESIAPFNQRYLGTIIEKADAQNYRVSLRDQTQQDVDGRALYLEARADVLAEMEQVASRESGQASIQRRILQLTHSLKPDGRRNPGILRDQLASALKVLDPSDRGQVSIPLRPNAEGELWVNCYATGVQRT
jgi:hypothetical protein